MALLKGIPTLQHMVTKKYSRPNNIFITEGLNKLITACEVNPELKQPYTDHYTITTNILIPQKKATTNLNYNFRDVDWKSFKTKLSNKLNTIPIPTQYQNSKQIKLAINLLTQSIQSTIKEAVMQTKPRPDAKCWWSSTS